MKLSNLNFARKISVVLGATILLLAGLCGLSLWTLRATERLAADSADQLTKARLAETIAGETAAIGQNKLKMMDAKKASPEILAPIAELRRNRLAALDDFTSRAKTPEDSEEGKKMGDLIHAAESSTNRVIASLDAGRIDEASREFRQSSSNSGALRATAKDALKRLTGLAAGNDTERSRASSRAWSLLIGGALTAIVGALMGGLVLVRSIAQPIGAVVEQLDRIAGGDLSADASPELQARADEIGTLARSTQSMTDSLRTMIREVSGGIQVLSSSSAQLLSASGEMTEGARQASDRAHSVSAAAEEMTANIGSVAAGMEQTTTNLTLVASTTEQMTATIGEIAQNSEKARRITDQANAQAARITTQIDQLGAATREIGKISDTITEISSQTNLLALNATIEAARAGSAGKGFAVVATEIKALAQQTATATEDIRSRIAGVQAATASGIAEIGRVSQVIEEVTGIVATIAAAIEEQSTATRQIASSIAEASTGVGHANSRVAETSYASREVARDIEAVDRASVEMAHGSDHVRTSATELATVADRLKSTIARFQDRSA
jgi:methyl-accepting chemotaxis protein